MQSEVSGGGSAAFAPFRKPSGFVLRLGILLAILLVLLGIRMGSAIMNQESMVFFPDKTLRGTPADVGLAFEEAALKTADGLTLGAWWVPSSDPRGAVIVSHGNAGNVSDRLGLVRFLHEQRFHVLAYDYRGYGRSEGAPTEAGTYLDLQAAVRYVEKEKGVPPGRTILFGESLGCAVTVEQAARRTPGGVILESAFTSIRAMARRHYPWIPIGPFLRIGYDNLAKVGELKCPKLFLHSPEDEIVPYSMGRDLFQAALPPKEFADLEGGHNGGAILASPRAQLALERWLGYVLQSAPEPVNAPPPGGRP